MKLTVGKTENPLLLAEQPRWQETAAGEGWHASVATIPIDLKRYLNCMLLDLSLSTWYSVSSAGPACRGEPWSVSNETWIDLSVTDASEQVSVIGVSPGWPVRLATYRDELVDTFRTLWGREIHQVYTADDLDYSEVESRSRVVVSDDVNWKTSEMPTYDELFDVKYDWE